jgi:hypothetical protein
VAVKIYLQWTHQKCKGPVGVRQKQDSDWKHIDWTHEQLKNVVITHDEGEFDDYS